MCAQVTDARFVLLALYTLVTAIDILYYYRYDARLPIFSEAFEHHQ